MISKAAPLGMRIKKGSFPGIKGSLTANIRAFLQNPKDITRLRIKPWSVILFTGALLITVRINSVVDHTQKNPDLFHFDLSTSMALDNSPKTGPHKKDTDNMDAKELVDVDLSLVTREQFQTLMKLAKRRREEEACQHHLPEQKAALEALEKRLNERVEELHKTRTSLEKMLKTFSGKENESLMRLVKVAENMKPKEAAQILETIDFQVLLELMQRIKPRKASEILSQMPPLKAGYLIGELSKKRQLTRDMGDAPLAQR